MRLRYGLTAAALAPCSCPADMDFVRAANGGAAVICKDRCPEGTTFVRTDDGGARFVCADERGRLGSYSIQEHEYACESGRLGPRVMPVWGWIAIGVGGLAATGVAVALGKKRRRR